MNLNDFFWGLGDLFYWAFENTLDEDAGLTPILNYGLLTLGFLGFFIWMSKQAKFNKQAASNPDQLK